MLLRLLRSLVTRPAPRAQAGYPVVLPGDNRRLTPAELASARRISEDTQRLVRERDAYVAAHGIDPRFALPDANWSYDAPNEFVRLFLRLARAERETLEHFRGFCQVFSGYNLYGVRSGYGIASAGMALTDDMDREIAEALETRNLEYVRLWRDDVAGLPARYVLSPPRRLGECGHEVDGVVVNYDTCNYQQRASVAWRSGLCDWMERRIAANGELRVCEIGGGYGAFALWCKSAFPKASVTIVDLPECLLFSRLYLELNHPDLPCGAGTEERRFGLRFVPNYMAGALDGPFDLVVNTISMSEMSELQVDTYASLIAGRWLRDGGVFLEQNGDKRHAGLLHAERVLAPHFAHRATLAPSGRLMNDGALNLWSTQPASLVAPATPPSRRAS